MEGNLIRLRNIEKNYALRVGKFHVLRRINLDVNEGEVIKLADGWMEDDRQAGAEKL